MILIPRFGEIRSIIIDCENEKNIIFVLSKIITEYYDSHLASYKVKYSESTSFNLVHIDDISPFYESSRIRISTEGGQFVTIF